MKPIISSILFLIIIFSNFVSAMEFNYFISDAYTETTKYKLSTQYNSMEAGLVGTESFNEYLDFRFGLFYQPHLIRDYPLDFEFFNFDFHQLTPGTIIGTSIGRNQISFGFDNQERLHPKLRWSVLPITDTSLWNYFQNAWDRGDGVIFYGKQNNWLDIEIEAGKLKRFELEPHDDYVLLPGVELERVETDVFDIQVRKLYTKVKISQLEPKVFYTLTKDHYTGSLALVPTQYRILDTLRNDYRIAYWGIEQLVGNYRIRYEDTKLYHLCEGTSQKYFTTLYLLSGVECKKTTNHQTHFQVGRLVKDLEVYIGYTHLVDHSQLLYGDIEERNNFAKYITMNYTFKNNYFIKTEIREVNGRFWQSWYYNPDKLGNEGENVKYNIYSIQFGFFQ